jgi:hypothetical protein
LIVTTRTAPTDETFQTGRFKPSRLAVARREV